MSEPRPQGQSGRFFIAYGAALAGATIGYVPFLAILLPMQVAGLAGEEARITWLYDQWARVDAWVKAHEAPAK